MFEGCHPRTHTTWHRVAPQLAGSFSVVCPDLRGYGQSTLPADAPEHAQSSKRAMAVDVVSLMRRLGHEQFAVVGHDRGSLVAFRAAMDHPDAVTRLVVMDGLPVVEHLERLNETFVRTWWHWWFMGQTDKPAERVINLDPDAEDDIDIHGSPAEIWRPWVAGELRSGVIHSGHHQAEQAPDELAQALIDFLSAPARPSSPPVLNEPA